MFPIPTMGEATLDHQAFFVEVARAGHVLAGSRDGRFTWLAPSLSVRGRFALRETLDCVALAPSGEVVVACTEGTLSVVGPFDGELYYSTRVGDGAACAFSADGAQIWTAYLESSDAIVVQLRSARDGRVLRERHIDSPAPDSTLSLHAHPAGDAIVLWVAAGQDGQWLLFARDDGERIEVNELVGVNKCVPPAFDASGRAFLLVEGDRRRSREGRSDRRGKHRRTPAEANWRALALSRKRGWDQFGSEPFRRLRGG